MSIMRVTEARSEEARDTLRKILTPGQEVYVVNRHVSTSGMSRRVSVFAIDYGHELGAVMDYDGYAAGDNPTPDPTDYRLRDITILVGQAARFSLVETPSEWEIRIGGAGMDMHFHLVYSLGRTLWPDDAEAGYALKKVTL